MAKKMATKPAKKARPAAPKVTGAADAIRQHYVQVWVPKSLMTDLERADKDPRPPTPPGGAVAQGNCRLRFFVKRKAGLLPIMRPFCSGSCPQNGFCHLWERFWYMTDDGGEVVEYYCECLHPDLPPPTNIFL